MLARALRVTLIVVAVALVGCGPSAAKPSPAAAKAPAPSVRDYSARIDALIRERDYARALELVERRALIAHPASPDLIAHRVTLLWRLGRKDEAIAAATPLAGDRFYMIELLRARYYLARAPGRAIAALENYIRLRPATHLRPDHFWVQMLAQLYIRVGRFDDAIDRYRSITWTATSPRVRAAAAAGTCASYTGARRFKEAVEACTKVTARYGADQPTAWHNLSIAHLHAGDLEAAQKAAEQHVRLRPDSPKGYSLLARIAARAGDPRRAARYEKEARERAQKQATQRK